MPVLRQNSRGVKQKRFNSKELEEDREAKLRRKLYQALRELRKVVKKARTFEVQKTLKKLKDARRKDSQSDVTKDLEVQMEILKHLDHDQLARSALMTKLKKDKTLSADATVQTIAAELASGLLSPEAPGTPTAKVQSRILSSKILAAEVTSTVEVLRAFLHPPVGSDGTGKATDSSRNDSKKRRAVTGRERDAPSSEDNSVDPSVEWRDEGYENTGADEAVAEVDDGWESGTVDVPSGSDDPVADDHDTRCGDSGERESASDDPRSKTPRPRGSKGQSEFLPSLSVGFTRGDSDSEMSGGETRWVGGTKKNRRGQRARRAIWEKKYGRNANHVRRQQGTEHHRPGSVPVDRRSAKGNSRSAYPRQGPTLKRSVSTQSSGPTKGQSDRIRRKGDLRGKQDEPPLHPSWEAKRKHKSANIISSQGTKIVFES